MSTVLSKEVGDLVDFYYYIEQRIKVAKIDKPKYRLTHKKTIQMAEDYWIREYGKLPSGQIKH